MLGARHRIVARGLRYGGDVVDVGVHRELGDARGLHLDVGEPERVGEHDLERADGEDAASFRRQSVRGAGDALGRERRHDEVRAVGARHAVAQIEHGGAQSSEVANAKVDTTR